MIEKNFNEALVNEDVSVKSLISMFTHLDTKNNLGNSAIYHHFPIYPDENGSHLINANLLFISQNHGIIICQCINFAGREEIQQSEMSKNLAEIDRLIFAKILKDAPKLQNSRRTLKIEITPIIFIQNFDIKPDDVDDFEIVTTPGELYSVIERYNLSPLTDDEYKDLKATIEGSKAILKPAHRALKDKDDTTNSKGAILTTIENDICAFDYEQKGAALFILDGPQRIRGLAGSGKTIILAMKVAQIHLQNPNAEILYTYYTKALHDLVKRYITRFYRQFADKDPNWNKIHIMHAWGGKSLEGVYYNTCIYNGISPINLKEANILTPYGRDAFDFICEQLNNNKLKQAYDYVLLDEAQDFPVYFYRLCLQITKNNRLVWAYDDFQNILNVKLQNEKETFGKDENGNWHIDFSQHEESEQLQDLVLHRCYRNPRKILIAAFALGLGIYNYDLRAKKYKVLQRLENNEHWFSLGFSVDEGNSDTGSIMKISRPIENSPLLKTKYLENESEIIKIRKFENFNQECEAIVQSIIDDLAKELNPEDISVVCMDNRNAKAYVGQIASLLEDKGIQSFDLLQAPTDNVIFRVQNHVTLSSIYRAKGNEAGSVYIVGIDTVFNNKNDVTERNKIFTAMTRGLAWITLTGVGDSVQHCIQEFEKLKENNFNLLFTQPSEEDVRTIMQDITKKQSTLTKIDRLTEELGKLNMSQDEIMEEIKRKLFSKKK